MFRFGLQNLRYRKITFFYYALVSIFSVPSRLIKPDSSLSLIFLSMSLGVLITLIALPMLWVVCTINQKFELGKRNVAIPLALIALVGAIRGEILQNLFLSFDLQDNLRPFFAVASSTIFTLIYFIVISSFMEIVLNRREQFDQAFAQASLLVASSGKDLSATTDPRKLYESTLSGVRDKVKAFELENLAIESEDLLKASQEIQNQINDVLRPLSHRLWVNGMGQVKHRSLLGILKNATQNLDFDPRYIIGYQLFIGGYGISLVLGLYSGIILSIVAVMCSIFLIIGYRTLLARIPRNSFLPGLVFLILEGLVPTFLPLALPGSFNDEASLVGAALISPSIPGLILLISAYRLIIKDREMAIGAINSVIFQNSSPQGIGNLNQQGVALAEYFHNSLQSELFGIAKRLENTSQVGNNCTTRNIVNDLEEALSRQYDEISSEDFDGVERIAKLISSWEGITSISIAGTEFLSSKPALARRTSQILEELITNTIRYGRADEIRINLEFDPNQLQIFLTHNGKGAISKQSGLGSLFFKLNSDSGVSITTETGKTVVRINLPYFSDSEN